MIHIGSVIRKRIERTGINKSELARRINVTPQNMYNLLERKSIDTELLSKLCRELDYDFFALYRNDSAEDGPCIKPSEQALRLEEYNNLKRNVEFLRNENHYLKLILELHEQ